MRRSGGEREVEEGVAGRSRGGSGRTEEEDEEEEK